MSDFDQSLYLYWLFCLVWIGVVWFSEFVCLGTMVYINIRGLQKRSFQKFRMVPVQIYNGWHGQAQQPAIATTKHRTWRLLASPGAVVSSQGVLGKRSSEGVELVWNSCLPKKRNELYFVGFFDAFCGGSGVRIHLLRGVWRWVKSLGSLD